MDEIDKTSSASASPRSIHSYHRGNGTLRGGGIQKYTTLKGYKRKLDYRLGYCIIGCLITISTALTIFGLFHETAHRELSRYIESTRQIIVESILVKTSPIPELQIDSTVFDNNALSEEFEIDDQLDDYDHGNDTAPEALEGMVVSSEENDEPREEENDDNDDISGKGMLPSSSYNEPETCLGSVYVDEEKCLTATELDKYHDMLYSSHIALWNLITVNIIFAILLAPFTFMFHTQDNKNHFYKIFHRIILFLALFFMAAQIFVLVNPLLYSSFMYPTIVDRLFVEKLPRDQRFIKQVEFQFACQFDYIIQLVELNLQKACIPRIKNLLLLPYAIVLLIVIDLLPFVFIFFTYAWDKWLKDSIICKTARKRIELNNQRRPQSREDILKKTMEEPHYV
ncbi:hypothetical protein DINM_007271 [Dirofilaria immitis]|nr:hypothetical protein [Dirofilaria immitis]